VIQQQLEELENTTTKKLSCRYVNRYPSKVTHAQQSSNAGFLPKQFRI
jgi:hypothetical protein